MKGVVAWPGQPRTSAHTAHRHLRLFGDHEIRCTCWQVLFASSVVRYGRRLRWMLLGSSNCQYAIRGDIHQYQLLKYVYKNKKMNLDYMVDG